MLYTNKYNILYILKKIEASDDNFRNYILHITFD
jgi:hypothetical protein